ncbi:sushi, von Willebrand factor type A, EGF and pentraxin domain-containing protein 1-like isoform X2 [Stegostoma tigrinum]|uniref:sushi, von Willebrand factor type A, EGF and pentraxin domain-containing protein 1-like isoform X2 n=1 Tax=Stegostoma tigrinum TaxID=3053191 RepID=UPI00202B42DF|nr:sushi, von Willebrand factor type A, EGF and pentraxin domain-containing protein 1-like isoform X2 [Stegostoma tigrinum]
MTKMFQKFELTITFICIVRCSIAVIDPDCGEPKPLENGSFEIIRDANSRLKVKYQCLPGYTLTGSRYQSCDKSVWQQKPPKCEPITCGNPGEILNGYYNATSAEFGSRVSFYCNSGFKLVGNVHRICEAHGWSGHVPICEVVKCNYLEPITNGRTPSPPNGDYWEHGMVAKYSCDNDYSLIGVEELVCTETGEWNNNPPICKAVHCERPELPENANIVAGFGPSYKYRETITYSCKYGYKVEGDNVIECNENSEFSPPPPTCQLSGCREPMPIKNGEITNKRPVYELHEEITYKCRWGYKLIGHKVIRCVENHRFEPSPPACIRITCMAPQRIANGRILSTQYRAYEFNSALSFDCRYGFKPVADGISICNEDGQFHPPPTCERVTCMAPQHIANGRILSTQYRTYELNSALSFDCRYGFKPVADGISTCNEDGQFHPPPTCERVTCMAPQRIANGRILSTQYRAYELNSALSFDCRYGFKPVADGISTCNEDGQFHPPPTCERVTCTATQRIANGQILSQRRTYELNSILSYECYRGFKPVGISTCKGDGRFQPPPTCERATCTAPYNIKNGKITSAQSTVYELNSALSFECNYGFKPVADGISTCNEDGQFHPPPTCERDPGRGLISIQDKLKDIVALGKQMVEEKERSIKLEQALFTHETANLQNLERILQNIEQLVGYINNGSQIC